MKPQYDFKIEVNEEKMLACEILDDLSDHAKNCVLDLNPGESTDGHFFKGKQVKISRPYPTIEEEMEAYHDLGGMWEDSLNADR